MLQRVLPSLPCATRRCSSCTEWRPGRLIGTALNHRARAVRLLHPSQGPRRATGSQPAVTKALFEASDNNWPSGKSTTWEMEDKGGPAATGEIPALAALNETTTRTTFRATMTRSSTTQPWTKMSAPWLGIDAGPALDSLRNWPSHWQLGYHSLCGDTTGQHLRPGELANFAAAAHSSTRRRSLP